MASFPTLLVMFNTVSMLRSRTIWLLHDAYTHPHYLRTWWYNCTYVLYASVIVLYLILLDGSGTPGYEPISLITVVRKALDVLDAMTDIEVARPCAALIQEVLQVAEAYIRNNSGSDQVRKEISFEQLGGPAFMARDQASDTPLGASVDAPSRSDKQSWTTTDLCSTRDDLLANLMDSSLLEGFAMGLDDPSFASFDISMPDLGLNLGVGPTV